MFQAITQRVDGKANSQKFKL